MSTGTKRNKLSRSKKNAEPQAPTKNCAYLSDKKRYEKRCQQIFKAWKESREEDAKTRKEYARIITRFVGLQVAVVYIVIGVYFCCPAPEPTTARAVELLGVASAILAQSFGVFYLVVKYFFGKRPEDLEKISTFFLKCHPSRFGSGYKQHRDQ